MALCSRMRVTGLDEHQLNMLKGLSATQKEMVYCVFSRHFDGFVREKCLMQFIDSKNLFVQPYILQLLGVHLHANMQHLN